VSLSTSGKISLGLTIIDGVSVGKISFGLIAGISVSVGASAISSGVTFWIAFSMFGRLSSFWGLSLNINIIIISIMQRTGTPNIKSLLFIFFSISVTSLRFQ
jgi:hypothetical protein